MAQGEGAGSSMVDLLDRLLDKGIVIDFWRRPGSRGIDLVSGRERLRVVSIETYEGRPALPASPESLTGPSISDLGAELSRVRRDSDPSSRFEDRGA